MTLRLQPTARAAASAVRSALAMLVRPVDRLLTRHVALPDVTNPPVVIGHRGAPRAARENTLASALHALQAGADGVELDVQLHGGTAWVSHDRPPPADAERLEAVLAALAGRAGRIYLDVKRPPRGGQVEATVGLVAEAIHTTGVLEAAVVITSPRELAVWRETAPEVALLQRWTGPRPRRTRYPVNVARRHRMRHVGLFHTGGQLGTLGRVLHPLGLVRTAAWRELPALRELVAGNDDLRFVAFTINDPFVARIYASQGFAIGTDRPAEIRRALEAEDDG